MKKALTTTLIVLLHGCTHSQVKYSINYTKPTKLVVKDEYTIAGKNYYEVYFLDSAGRLVKMMQQRAIENHHIKGGYEIQNEVNYSFWKDTLETWGITLDVAKRRFWKTEYIYNSKGKALQLFSYSYKPKVSKDSFNNIVKNDFFLNHPEAFPTKGLMPESKLVRQYDDSSRLVYKCWYYWQGKLKQPMADREYIFKYNNKGQLIEYITNPKEGALGESGWRDTFEYNNKGDLALADSYEDGKHFCLYKYNHEDTVIIVTETYDQENEPNPKLRYFTTKVVYKRGSDGNYYSGEFNNKFAICPELESAW